MNHTWALVAVMTAAVAAAGRPATSWAPAPAAAQPPKRPSLTLTASPMVAATPAKVFFLGELKGGSDDYEDLYCPTVEWDWGDDTSSESTVQCEPYEPGTSLIQRRYSTQHEFKTAGTYRVQLKLKKKNKVIVTTHVLLRVTQGVDDSRS